MRPFRGPAESLGTHLAGRLFSRCSHRREERDFEFPVPELRAPCECGAYRWRVWVRVERGVVLDNALMLLEYFEDLGEGKPPVLLTYDDSPSDARPFPAEAALLRVVAEELAADDDHPRVQIDELAGFHGVDGCSLCAEVGPASIGLTPIDSSRPAFRCVLDRADWHRVVGLLEPFVDPVEAPNRNGFQYLSESGPIGWIISMSRGW